MMSGKLKNKIVIASGGTGGHIFPAISLSSYLKDKYHIKLTTDKRGKNYIDNINQNFEIKLISASTIFQKNPFKIVYSIFLILFSIIESVIFLINFNPKIIIGMGGYSSFPICVAARVLRIPVIIYENNLVIGKANKYLLPIVNQIFLSFSETKKINPKYKSKIFLSGSIIRKEVENYKHIADFNKEKIKIVIMGGSQAAEIFGTQLPRIFKKCQNNGINLSVVQQCLNSQKEELTNFYKEKNIGNEVFTFRSDVTNIFKSATIVITRGGASAQAELVNCNIPYIVIPLKYSADNHQLENALYYEKKGCNILVQEDEIDTKLFELIKKINKDRSILHKIVQNQQKLSNQNVLEKVKNQIEIIINN